MLTGPGGDDDEQGGEALVAAWENQKFRALQTKLQQEFRRPAPGRKHIKGRHIPAEIAEEINYQLVEQTILLDWRDINVSEGVPLMFNKETSAALLRNEEQHWFFNDIVAASMDEAGYRQEEAEEDVENLPSTLPGNSKTEKMLNGLSN